MRPPLDRDRLKRRNEADRVDDLEAAAHRAPAQSFADTLDLCEVVRKLAEASGTDVDSANTLADKARLYVRPLTAARTR